MCRVKANVKICTCRVKVKVSQGLLAKAVLSAVALALCEANIIQLHMQTYFYNCTNDIIMLFDRDFIKYFSSYNS